MITDADVSERVHGVAPPRAESRALLDIRDLRVEAMTPSGPVAVIDGLNLRIGHGEIVALVGESGSGKSMTAQSITRLLPPSVRIAQGSIHLGDRDLAAASEKEMQRVRGDQVALLFQHPKAALDPTCRIGDQVVETLRGRRRESRRQSRERSIALLGDVGIPEAARRSRGYSHQLSGGMAQRVMIAAALSGDPQLLIADEPTTALDVTVQAQILRLLLEKRRVRNLSILLITHDMGIVANVADRVAVMLAGRIVEDRPVADLFASPEHPYTESLLRSSLMLTDADGRLFVPDRTIRAEGSQHGPTGAAL